MRKIILMVAAVLPIAACSTSTGDSYSSDAGLSVDHLGMVTPSKPIESLADASIAFKVGPGFNVQSGQPIAPGDNLLLIDHGFIRICTRNADSDPYVCEDPQNLGKPSSQSYGFNIANREGLNFQGTIGIAPMTLKNGTGDQKISVPAQALYYGLYGQSADGVIDRSTEAAYELLYVPRKQLTEEKFVGVDGQNFTPFSAASSSKSATVDFDTLKRNVISQIASEHNFSPSDVIKWDANVDSPSMLGKTATYHVTGSFVVHASAPSNVYEAATQRVDQNICAIAPDKCNTNGFQHTVYFDATVSSYEKLDGTDALRIQDRSSVDKDLNVSNRDEADQAFAQGNYSQAFKLYEPLAVAGDKSSQTQLGWMYEHGKGVPQDYTQAFSWYQKSSAQGDPAGEDNLGKMYEYGRGTPQSYAQALTWYQKASAQGHADAEDDLGALYTRGLGVTKDYTQAFQLFQKSASQGNVYAESNLANAYENGLGTPRDYALAMSWYQKAAAQGSAIAEMNIGLLYDQGYGVSRDSAQAMIWYQKAAAQGDDNAEQLIGRMYDTGQGVLQDYKQAMQWYEKSAAHGNAYAEDGIAMLYESGHGVEQNYAEAMSWYQKAAAQGDATAEVNIGVIYESGKGVPQDKAQAISWYQKAAAHGNAYAQESIRRLQ